MRKTLLILPLLLLLLSCNSNNEKNNTEKTLSVNNDTVCFESMEQTRKDSICHKWISYYKTEDDSAFNEWKSFYTAADTSFSIDKFEIYNISKREEYECCELGEVNPIYEPFFIYSPDKKKYIDIDSYIWWPEKESANTRLISGFDVDQEIFLVDIDAQTKQRLEFFGPSTAVEDVCWVNDHIVTLLMWSHGTPAFLIINLSTNKKIYFQYPKEIHADNSYLMSRLQKKGLQLKNEKL